MEYAIDFYVFAAFVMYVLLLEMQDLKDTDWKAPVIPAVLWPVVALSITVVAVVYLAGYALRSMEVAIEYSFDTFEGWFK